MASGILDKFRKGLNEEGILQKARGVPVKNIPRLTQSVNSVAGNALQSIKQSFTTPSTPFKRDVASGWGVVKKGTKQLGALASVPIAGLLEVGKYFSPSPMAEAATEAIYKNYDENFPQKTPAEPRGVGIVPRKVASSEQKGAGIVPKTEALSEPKSTNIPTPDEQRATAFSNLDEAINNIIDDPNSYIYKGKGGGLKNAPREHLLSLQKHRASLRTGSADLSTGQTTITERAKTQFINDAKKVDLTNPQNAIKYIFEHGIKNLDGQVDVPASGMLLSRLPNMSFLNDMIAEFMEQGKK